MATHDTDGRSDRRRNRGEVRNSFKELAKLASEIPPSQASLPPAPPSMPAPAHPAINAASLVDDFEEANEIVTEDRTPPNAKLPPSARFSVPPVAVPMAPPSVAPQPVAMSVTPQAARPSRGVGRAVTVGAFAGLFISALGIGGMVLMKKTQSAAVDEPRGATAIHVAAQPVFGADAPASKPAAAPPAQPARAAKTAPKPSDGTLSIDDLPQAKKPALPAWYASRSYAPARKPVAAPVAAPADAPAPPPEAKVETKPEPKAAEKPAEAKAAETKTVAAAAPEPKPAPVDVKGAAAAPADQGSGTNALLDEIRAAVKKESKK